MVEALLRRERRERREQVLAERAADAPIRQLDHLLLLLQHAAVTHELRIDIDGGHVVHDDGDASPGTIVEHVVEKRRLARAKEAREHRDGQRSSAARLAYKRCGLEDSCVRVWLGAGDDRTPHKEDGGWARGRFEICRLQVGARQAVGCMKDDFQPIGVVRSWPG